jgi:hypothetical protein
MKTRAAGAVVAVMAVCCVFAMQLSCTGPSESSITVLTPQGPVAKANDLAPRLDSLDGKKIAMWLSATEDHLYAGKGAELYDELIAMLENEYPGIEIVPYNQLPMKYAPLDEVVKAIVAAQPDGVVAGFGG